MVWMPVRRTRVSAQGRRVAGRSSAGDGVAGLYFARIVFPDGISQGHSSTLRRLKQMRWGRMPPSGHVVFRAGCSILVYVRSPSGTVVLEYRAGTLKARLTGAAASAATDHRPCRER